MAKYDKIIYNVKEVKSLTTGEKIKLFRNLKKLSQKTLADLSGMSEIAIRKYEAGDRIPKPEQLKKLEKALGLDEGFLSSPPLNNLTISTVGDIMSLLFMLEEQGGLIFSCQKDQNGIVIPDTANIRFANIAVNNAIAQWIQYKESKMNRASVLENFTPEEADRMKILEITLEEAEKQRLMKDTAPIKPIKK